MLLGFDQRFFNVIIFLMPEEIDELERRDLNTALVTLCAGGGIGIATIIERV